VGCALDATQYIDITVNGVVLRYSGQLGIAPEWASKSCDGSCQTAVSACVLSRLNYLGEQVQISLRGGEALLTADSSESATFTDREAAYFGNVFSIPQQRYACLPRGKTSLPRVCGPSITNCVVQVTTCDCLTDNLVSSDYEYCKFGSSSNVMPITVYLHR
jgi:hypothetical protein